MFFRDMYDRNGGLYKMKAILLAAGRGTRISRMVKEIPKSTLPIQGIPLIRFTVDMLQKKGIDTVSYTHLTLPKNCT